MPPVGRRPVSLQSSNICGEHLLHLSQWKEEVSGATLTCLEIFPWPCFFKPLCHAGPSGGARCESVWGHGAAHEDWHHHLAREVSLDFLSHSKEVLKLQNCQILSIINDFKLPTPLPRIFVHSYDYQTLDYDIMLIKLFHPVKVTESVAPIPLPTGCPYGGHMCSVSGWGKTSNDENGELTFCFESSSFQPFCPPWCYNCAIQNAHWICFYLVWHHPLLQHIACYIIFKSTIQ